MANKDPKGLGADGVGGGDAPGMKMAEAPGTEGKPTIKKVKHSCATKVEHSEWGKGNCIKEMHASLMSKVTSLTMMLCLSMVLSKT